MHGHGGCRSSPVREITKRTNTVCEHIQKHHVAHYDAVGGSIHAINRAGLTLQSIRKSA